MFEKSGLEKFMVEKSGVKGQGLNLKVEMSGVEMAFNRNYIIRNIGNLIIFFPFFSVPIPSEAKESKPDVVEELMKKMFMRKVMAKFFGDANGMLSIYVHISCPSKKVLQWAIFMKQNWADLCNYFEFNSD